MNIVIKIAKTLMWTVAAVFAGTAFMTCFQFINQIWTQD